MNNSLLKKIFNWYTKTKEFELWVKVPMTCKSKEDKTEIILNLIDVLERNIKVKP